MKSTIASCVVLLFSLVQAAASSDFAPDILEGLTLQITETTNDNNVFYSEFYFTQNTVYFKVPLSNTFKAISYSYAKSQSNISSATLTMFGRDEGDVTHEIVFSSSTSATSSWEDNSSSGLGNLEISGENLVSSFLGDLVFSGSSTSSTRDIFKFEDSNNALYYNSITENFSDRELSRITYTWEQNASRIGKLTTSLGETLFLFFDSNATGYFYWTEITNEKDKQSGPFNLNNVSGGYAYTSLVGSTITIGDIKYLFLTSNTTETQSASGSTLKEFAYLKNSYNEALLFVNSNLYRLVFQSIDSGFISEGGEGVFQVSHNVSTKGWVFNSYLPWVYSNKIGAWYYQALFSNNDSNITELAHFESWRNTWTKNDDLEFSDHRVFSKNPVMSYPKGWMWTEHLPWAYSFEKGGWLYFELANDADGNPAMNYYDYSTKSWGLYGSP